VLDMEHISIATPQGKVYTLEAPTKAELDEMVAWIKSGKPYYTILDVSAHLKAFPSHEAGDVKCDFCEAWSEQAEKLGF